jgi:hypothetical protein
MEKRDFEEIMVLNLTEIHFKPDFALGVVG